MHKSLENILFMLLAMIVITATIATANHVKAQATTVAITPASIIDPSLGPGSTFIINLTVADVANMFTWQAQIMFKPSMLSCNNATFPADNVFAGKPIIPVTPIMDNVGGSVTFGASMVGAGPVFTGTGVLCQIGFTVVGWGNSTLNYSVPYGSDTFLLDSDLSVIPSMVTNGYFENKQYVEPQPPVALFDYLPKPVLVGQVITFNGSASYDPDGSVVLHHSKDVSSPEHFRATCSGKQSPKKKQKDLHSCGSQVLGPMADA